MRHNGKMPIRNGCCDEDAGDGVTRCAASSAVSAERTRYRHRRLTDVINHSRGKIVRLRRGAIAIPLGVVMTATLATPASARLDTSQLADVEFSVFETETGIPRHSDFGLDELSGYGVPRSIVDALATSASPVFKKSGATASRRAAPAGQLSSFQRMVLPPNPPSSPNRYDIAGEWRDRDNWATTIRHGYWNGGAAGFGLAKVEGKHNLTLEAVRAVTKYPRPGPTGKRHIAGSKYNYETDVLHVTCSGRWIFKRCRVVEVQAVLVGVDFRRLDDNKPFGVVTGFCVGITGQCPDWVKNAINI